MNAEQKTPNHIPNHVIEAILNHIPFDGWSKASLDMAAADCGLSEAEMHSLFPAGVVDAISAYGAYADQNMIIAFHGQDAADIAVMPVHMKIRSLILIRLEQAAPHKEVVRRTFSHNAFFFFVTSFLRDLQSSRLEHLESSIWVALLNTKRN